MHAQFDVLIYAAGALAAHDIDELDLATMEYLYRVNVFAPMVLESGLLDLIESNGADVINITSSSIIDFYPAFSEYSSSKAALAKFTTDLRARLERTAARVTELCPSGFASSMYASMRGTRIARDETIQIPVEVIAQFMLTLLDLPKRMEVGRVFINRKIVS